MAFVAMQRFGIEVSANIGKHTMVTASHHSSLPHKAPDVSNAGRFVMITMVVCRYYGSSVLPRFRQTTCFSLGVLVLQSLSAFAARYAYIIP